MALDYLAQRQIAELKTALAEANKRESTLRQQLVEMRLAQQQQRSAAAAVSADDDADDDVDTSSDSDSGDSVESFEEDDDVDSLRARIRAQRDDFAVTLDNLEALFDAAMQKEEG